jgi:hypothetical protein
MSIGRRASSSSDVLKFCPRFTKILNCFKEEQYSPGGKQLPAEDYKVRMAPYESPIWRYFRKDKRSDGKRSATCRVCKKSLAMSLASTTSLCKHLKAKHGEDYKEFLLLQNEALADYNKATEDLDKAEAEATKRKNTRDIIWICNIV